MLPLTKGSLPSLRADSFIIIEAYSDFTLVLKLPFRSTYWMYLSIDGWGTIFLSSLWLNLLLGRINHLLYDFRSDLPSRPLLAERRALASSWSGRPRT